MSKPKEIKLWEGYAECVTEDYDDHGGGAPVVVVDVSLYESKDIIKLISWLTKALVWKLKKEGGEK